MITRGQLAVGALVVALAVVAYLPGLPGGFAYDDYRLIVKNEGLQRPLDLRRAFLRDYYASDFDHMGLGYYRPVAILSNELDWRIGGGRAAVFHATNIAVHAACVALTMLLALRLFPRYAAAAALAGALFALHPAHAESVAFISGRVDPLATLFGLLALLAHLSGRRAWGAAAWLAAILSKEMAVTIPIVAALFDTAGDGVPLWRRSRSDLIRRYGPFVLAAAVYLPLRWTALGGLAPPPPPGSGLSVMRSLATIGSYVAWLIAPPPGLHLEPSLPLGPAAWLRAAGALAALAAAALLLRGGRRVQAALLACALVTLLPVAQVRVLETSLSERFLYLPSVFAMILAGWALASWRRRWTGAALAAMVGLGYLTLLTPRVSLWRDEIALWSEQTEEQPQSVRAWVSLAQSYVRHGDREAARAVYEHAGTLGLDRRVLAAEMASLLGTQGGDDEERVILDALEAAPQDGALWQNLGFVRLGRGNTDGAIQAFERATALVPGRSTGWLGMAYARLRNRQWAEARDAAERAASLDPELAVAHAIHGETLWRLGHACEAVRELTGLSLDDPAEAAATGRVLEAARADCAANRE